MIYIQYEVVRRVCLLLLELPAGGVIPKGGVGALAVKSFTHGSSRPHTFQLLLTTVISRLPTLLLEKVLATEKGGLILKWCRYGNGEVASFSKLKSYLTVIKKGMRLSRL